MNKKTMNELEEILRRGFELVSYGLAPNPFGFCYEFNGKGKKNLKVEKRLNEILDSLTEEETRQVLRRYL